MAAPVLTEVDALVERARSLAARGGRTILGISGPPGAGKSTVAAAVVAALGDAAVLVPMDGFHLAQATLVALGRRDRMGAPDTFDAAGYAALLRRLRANAEPVVYAPDFRRAIEEPIAGAIAVARTVPLVVTEGNYLLLDDDGWAPVRRLLDEAWHVDVESGTRVTRLMRRHVAFGKDEASARAWVQRSDEANAARVATTAARADVLVRLPG